ncbi:MAG TPA: hypothetical protein VK615_14140 [Candidatus Binatia bacterium]|nr:hypothetical protein [Candidatus Binatia bacterium]
MNHPVPSWDNLTVAKGCPSGVTERPTTLALSMHPTHLILSPGTRIVAKLPERPDCTWANQF